MLNLNDPRHTEQVAFNWELWDRDIFEEFDEEEISSGLSGFSKLGNLRKSVRYVRKDITAFISQPDIFGTYRLFSVSCAVKVRLFDISSRGSLIAGPSGLDLRKNQKVMLTLIFDSNMMFEFTAKVVREVTEDRKLYGIKFDKVNNDLGEYLLESQSDLIFKL